MLLELVEVGLSMCAGVMIMAAILAGCRAISKVADRG
jgi:hypothetical protein